MQQLSGFQSFITTWFEQNGRHTLPWRTSHTPYEVLISELMLQQTQVQRVIPKYTAFLKRFPTVQSLAEAKQSEVLLYWQGLGYNRRAQYVHLCAQSVCQKFAGTFPRTHDELIALPGVGEYTANALRAFAYSEPITLIETNIRAVFLYHFFPEQEKVSDAELLPHIAREVLTENPRLWYSALMDYGSYLKQVLPNPSRKSKHHSKQSTFKGSLRQVRGEVIRLLLTRPQMTEQELHATMTADTHHLTAALKQLCSENLIYSSEKGYTLAS